MRNQLPRKALRNECGIINLDDNDGPGTHWVAYYKEKKSIYYFDSFGDLQPPIEFLKYLGNDSNIFYNHKQYQNYKTTNCGQLCIQFLFNLCNKSKQKANFMI